MDKSVITKEQALAFNKASIFDAFETHGVTSAHVFYDGGGDSGQINEITFHEKNGKEVTPEFGSIPYLKITYGNYDPESKSFRPDAHKEDNTDLESVLENLCYELLSSEHGGWANNDGGQGEFTFETEDRTISLHHETNFMEVEVSEREF